MPQTLFIRRYPDDLTVTVRWWPAPGHKGEDYRGELELFASQGGLRLGEERHRVQEANLRQRERHSTALANAFIERLGLANHLSRPA
ncbi:hypothetical protein ED208_15165 [Stagnimonas aquatica]|uniref:Uncharacterized protein n=1 Tax=Stagnimonas aquatica TaxID=2689987 RepID=A0A3N0V1X0_9GAMM|nr:hypothetical protein [Stagnimonas aquatica]ROH86770.1 hypothetical protein ED208_15165 [Stagnimonas aquatica]